MGLVSGGLKNGDLVGLVGDNEMKVYDVQCTLLLLSYLYYYTKISRLLIDFK